MKLKLFLVLVILLCLVIGSWSQQSNKARFISINQLGSLQGRPGIFRQMQTINGIQYKTFSAGLGIGLDYYFLRTVPVFADLRKNLFEKPQTPFIYLDLGTSLPWVKKQTDPGYWYDSKYRKGLYYDLGLGYRVPISKTVFFSVSLGYSQKELHQTNYSHDIISPPNPTNFRENIDYTFRRFSMKTGLNF